MTTVHSCPACGLRFTYMAELTDHMRNDHLASPEEPVVTTWGQITVPLDPTADNHVTLDTAAAVARQAGMSMALVAVQGSGLDASSMEAFLRDQAHRAREAGVPHCAWHRLPEGDIAEGLLGVAAEGDTTLLCMATHSRGAVAEMVLGSVSEKVLRESPVPVLLIGPHTKVPDSEYSHLLVAVDGSTPSEAAVDVAAGLAPRLQADIALVQVLDPDLELPPDVDEHAFVRRIARRLPATRTTYEVVHDTHPDRGINGVASALPNALIVAGTHGRTGFRRLAMGSVALAIVRNSLAPVLVVGSKAVHHGGPDED